MELASKEFVNTVRALREFLSTMPDDAIVEVVNQDYGAMTITDGYFDGPDEFEGNVVLNAE